MGIQYSCWLKTNPSDYLFELMEEEFYEFADEYFSCKNGLDISLMESISKKCANELIVILEARTEDFNFENSDIQKHFFMNGKHEHIVSEICFPQEKEKLESFEKKNHVEFCNHEEKYFQDENGGSATFVCNDCGESFQYQISL